MLIDKMLIALMRERPYSFNLNEGYMECFAIVSLKKKVMFLPK